MGSCLFFDADNGLKGWEAVREFLSFSQEEVTEEGRRGWVENGSQSEILCHFSRLSSQWN